MKLTVKTMVLTMAIAGLTTSTVYAQDKVRIGFLTDMSSGYADLDGKNGAMAIQMAIDDFGGKVNGLPVAKLVGWISAALAAAGNHQPIPPLPTP